MAKIVLITLDLCLILVNYLQIKNYIFNARVTTVLMKPTF